MAEKTSVKTINAIFLLFGIALVLCACLNPVDIQAFLEDPQVQVIIESTRERVFIDEDSDDFDNLTAGSGKISGLTAGRYYMLEEYDEELVFKENLFIKADGTNWADLGGIGRLEGTQITNLKNNYTYKVKYAQPFNGGTAHKYFAFGDTAAKEADLSTGEVTIQGAKDYFLNVAPLIDARKGYQVMKIIIPGSGTNTPWGNSRTSAHYTAISNVFEIPIAPSPSSQYDRYVSNKEIGIYQYRTSVIADPPPTQHLNLNLQNMSLIALTGINTQSDYVFAEYDNNDNKLITKFVVLRVNRLDEIIVNVNVNVTYTSVNSPIVVATSPSAAQNPDSIVNLSVTNASDYKPVFEWYKDGVKTATTGAAFTFNINNENSASNKQIGAHLIMVVGYIGNVPYSTIITITVTE